LDELDQSSELLKDGDPEIKELARDEMRSLNLKKDVLENELKRLLIPKDPNDEKNVLIDIRAVRRRRSRLFAGDLFRMYAVARIRMESRGDRLIIKRCRRLKGNCGVVHWKGGLQSF
jgi:protein subunit release factor A